MNYDSDEKLDGVVSSTRRLIQQRTLVKLLTRNELRSRYKKSVLGIFWAQANPIITTSVIYFVFANLINRYMPMERGYAIYVFTGVLFQSLLISGLTLTSESLANGVPLLLKVRLQPIVFCFSSVAVNVINFLLGLLVIFPLALISNQEISPRIILLPVVLFLLSLFLTGISLLLCIIFMRFDDSKYLVGAVVMIISYLSPIFYPVEILAPRMKTIVESNPITHWIVVIRWCLLPEAQVDIWELVSVTVMGISVYVGGVLWLRRKWNDMVMLV